MLSHPEIQSVFRAALAGQDVPPGVTAVGDLERRFSVYRNTVTHSLIAALSQRFSVVRRIVGSEFFDAMAAVFVSVHPPRTPLIHAYGADFPAFLATFPPAATLPYLPDVARIEVMRGQAYHAADAVPMSGDAISTALGSAPDSAVLTLHPSLHISISDFPVVSIWRMNQPNATPFTPEPSAEAALVFRAAEDAVVLAVTPALAAIAAAMQDASPLGAVAEDHAPDAIAQALSVLMRHALIVGVKHLP
jgi:hypothetical protein